MKTTLRERLEQKYMPEPNSGCWLWLASTNDNGYGVIKVKGRFRGAHRVSYILDRGPIPDGLVIDHLCRNTLCVNPQHMEIVTIGENIRRGDNHHRRKTHCKRGHEFNADNTIHNAAGGRTCRIGNHIRMAQFLERKSGKP